MASSRLSAPPPPRSEVMSDDLVSIPAILKFEQLAPDDAPLVSRHKKQRKELNEAHKAAAAKAAATGLEVGQSG